MEKPEHKPGSGGHKRQAGANGGASRKKDDSTIQITRGTVWIKKDSLTIISRQVMTGLDDKTLVQVVSGLQEGEEVITGYKKMNKKDAANAQTAKSPFMPARNNNRKRPNSAGGGAGGGGGPR